MMDVAQNGINNKWKIRSAKLPKNDALVFRHKVITMKQWHLQEAY